MALPTYTEVDPIASEIEIALEEGATTINLAELKIPVRELVPALGAGRIHGRAGRRGPPGQVLDARLDRAQRRPGGAGDEPASALPAGVGLDRPALDGNRGAREAAPHDGGADRQG